jgi:cytochrome c-type biogenesis protein CcmF
VLTIGRALIALGLATALYGIAASIIGGRRRDPRWTASGRRAVYVLAVLLLAAFALLESAFLRSDFSVAVVARHSSTTTPAFYRATAIWSSQEGSLLLWVTLMAVWASAAVRIATRRLPDVTPYATAILLGFAGFFLALSVFWANPFQMLDPAPPEGAGLEPLLRHPTMMFHPPLLYSGYTLSMVPFAFSAAALLRRRVDGEWIATIRRFALAAWLVLGVGILLGARWSWTELGWGGYWAWDPVENAALMPWLTGTAFLHSLMLQQRRGVLKAWNVSLAMATGILAVLGTFLVRSGLLSSIHAFGASTMGLPFLCFIAVLLVGSVWLVAGRSAALAPDRRIGPSLSRESIFVLNNVLLLGVCAVVLWGTFFPLVSEALTGTKSTVGPSWFDRYTGPLAIGIVGLVGLATMLAWGATSATALARRARVPVLGALGVTAGAAALGATSSPSSLALFACAALVVAATAGELTRAVRARRAATHDNVARAVAGVVSRNRRRYGGYLVHVGVAVTLVGVAGSSAFRHIRDVRLSPGQHVAIGGYDVSYRHATGELASEKISLGALLDVRRHGKLVRTLHPTRGYYADLGASAGPISRFFDGESTSEVGLDAGAKRDLWTAVQPDLSPFTRLMNDADQRFLTATPNVDALVVAGLVAHYEASPPPATFRFIVSPLVEWIWFGGAIFVSGGLIALWPPGLLRTAAATVRLRRRPSLRPAAS